MNDIVSVDESFIQRKFDEDANRYERQYTDVITEAAGLFNSRYSKYGKDWSVNDSIALGQYLEQWEQYCQMFESMPDPTTRDNLGDYVKVGLGLAAIQYVSLPASFLASVQPIPDEVGIIYYRRLVATASRGNIHSGDVIGSIGGKLNDDLDTYYQESQSKTIAVTNGGTPYGGSLNAPVRERTMEVVITMTVGGTTSTYQGMDDGNGFIIGNWPVPAGLRTGAITYSNGALVINLADTGATAGSIVVNYHQNLAQASDIPGFQYQLTSKSVRANYFIIQNQYSTLADYTVRRRFGRALSEDIATSAVSQINSAVLSAIIRKLTTAAINTGTVTWDGTPDAGVSLADHRKTFTDAIEASCQLIDAQTGRGAASFILAGAYGRRVLQSIGAEMVRKPLPGPYLAGFFQNIPIFYVPQALLADRYCVVGYRGPSWFEAAAVYAPFLPVVMVKGSGDNPFNRITGVAHAAAIDTVVEGFCSRIDLNPF